MFEGSSWNVTIFMDKVFLVPTVDKIQKQTVFNGRNTVENIFVR